MKCAICGRQLKSTTKHHFIGGMPIGPTCYSRLDTKKVRIVQSKVIANEQPDLFEDGK